MAMDFVEIALVVANLLAGFGFAFPMAKVLSEVQGEAARAFRYYVMLIGIYFLESVVLMIGMGIPVLNVGLAFAWGLVFGRWLRARTSRRQAQRTSFSLSLYSSLPAISFLLVPLFAGLGGWNVLSAAGGARFGIPEFLNLLPPLNTILGFYIALVAGATALKVLITVGEVSLLISVSENPSLEDRVL